MSLINVHLPVAAACSECGFASTDAYLLAHHSCDVTSFGGRCEDFPCCGHEMGDCNGELYGSDESIKAQVYNDWATGHGYCDHAEGIYNCEDFGYDEDDDC